MVPPWTKFAASFTVERTGRLIDWAKTASKADIAGLTVQVFEAAAKGDKMPLTYWKRRGDFGR